MLFATTVGAGIFALPYVVSRSGWLVGLFYLLFFGALIAFVHYLYLQVLMKLREPYHLLGLVKINYGRILSSVAFLAIMGGLFLTLTAYLILAERFLDLIVPGLGDALGLGAFWLFASVPILLGVRRLVIGEALGAALMIAIVGFVVFATQEPLRIFALPAADLKNVLVPFGVVLFALAGWPAIEPMAEYQKKIGPGFRPIPALAWGTAAVVLVYVLFTVGIFGSAATITEDAVSGLTGWPAFSLALIGALGIFAIWTSYVPIGIEIKNTLVDDLTLPKLFSSGLVLFGPPLLVYLGLNQFLQVVGLVGGVFLALQYLLIILVGRAMLSLGRAQKFFLDVLAAAFILAAVYEIYYFIVG